MLVQETVQQLQHASVAERIHAIEILLESLKDDIVQPESRRAARERFTVRTFNLGQDTAVDREEMYAERASI